MGHKDGGVHSEAYEAPTDSELVEVLEQNRRSSIRQKMGAHTDLAVDTLVELAETGRTDTVRRRSARDILEYGHGRPAQQVVHTPGSGGGGGGVTINILRFSGGETEVKTVEGQAVDPLQALLEEGVTDVEAEEVRPVQAKQPLTVSTRRAARMRERMEDDDGS